MFLTPVKSNCPAERSKTLPYLLRSRCSLCHRQYMVSKVKLGCSNQPADCEE